MRKVEAKVRCKASGGGNAVFGMAEAVAAKVRLADEIGAAVGRMLAAGAV